MFLESVFFGRVGPQEVCVKVLRKSPQHEALFINEAEILSHCCHPNVCLLLGITTTNASYKCLLLSFHHIDGVSYCVDVLLHESNESFFINWKEVLLHIARGLEYLYFHKKGAIIHNDLKNDNIILEKSRDAIQPCIIDFGKSCFEENSKLYNLTSAEKETYRRCHPQIAPDVVDGKQR